MAKQKVNKVNNRLLEYLLSVKSPILDKRHNLVVYLDDNRARSNQTRFEHIVRDNHRLKVCDLKRLFTLFTVEGKLKKDFLRKDTYNYYLTRNSKGNEFIKMSIQLDKNDKSKGKIKTIFITRNVK